MRAYCKIFGNVVLKGGRRNKNRGEEIREYSEKQQEISMGFNIMKGKGIMSQMKQKLIISLSTAELEEDEERGGKFKISKRMTVVSELAAA